MLRFGLFHPIHHSALYRMDLGDGENHKINEVFITASLYGRVSLINATLIDDDFTQSDLLRSIKIIISPVMSCK